MPTDAFITAASAANRQPVVLLAIESVDAIKRQVTTAADWAACALTNANPSVRPGTLQLTTDDSEPLAGTYNGPVEAYAGGSFSPVGLVTTTPVFCSRDHVTGISITALYVQKLFIEDIPGTVVYYQLYGSRDGGGWTLLAETDGSSLSADLVRGTWQFKLAVVQTALAWDINFISIPEYQLRHETRYHATGSATTASAALDLGLVPTVASRFEADDVVPTGCSISYTAWGRNTTGAGWTSLGAVVDGGTLAAHRYYQITAALASSGIETPAINEIRIIGGDSQYTYLSTHKDTPVQGAMPYIVPGGISSISSKIDLIQQATVGELTARLFWRPQVGDMVYGDFLKNKTIICKLGFVGLSEVDYEPYFVGTWYDYQSDPDKGVITVKTRNVLKRFSKKIPTADYFLDSAGKQFSPAKLKTWSGNIMQVMLDIADELGIPDRLLNRASFTDLAAGSRTGSDWAVTRTVSEPQDAMEMLNELSVSSGVFLFEGADGCLTAKLYDDFVTAEPADTLDAVHCSFKPVDGGQKDLFTRSAIYYGLLPGSTGGSATDYSDCLLSVNQEAEIAWEETNTREWFDKWGISVVAIQLLAQRWKAWFSVPRATVRVDDVPPRFHSIERGQVVAVDNLQLVCPLASWQGYTSATRFLVMGKSISDPTSGSLTVSFDLMQLDDATFTTDPEFPDYSRLDYFPAVTGLAASERMETVGGIVVVYLDISFSAPAGFISGGCSVWTRTNSGDWIYASGATFGAADAVRRISLPVITGDVVQVAVSTIRPDGVQQLLADAPAITRTIIGKSAPPPSPGSFLIFRQPDGTRQFSWTLVDPPLDLAGYRIRYAPGSSADWADMLPLHSGLLLASPYETNQLSAGTYTFAIVSEDTSGNQSSPKYITAELAAQRMAGVILDLYPHQDAWPATKSDCYLDEHSQLVASDQKTWSDFATDGITWDEWTSWARSPHSPISYTTAALDLGSAVTFTPVVSASAEGTATVTMDYSQDNSTWNGFTALATVTARYVKIRISVASTGLAILRGASIYISGTPVTETLNDINTATLSDTYRFGAGDIRLPITKDYAVIKSVMVALQNIGAGWSWEIVEKDTTIGPRIKIYNASHTLSDCIIDADIKGL